TERRQALYAGGNRLQQRDERIGIGRLQALEAHAILLAERPHSSAPQCRDMAVAAQQTAHVAGERPHTAALAAFSAAHGGVGVWDVDETQAVDLDRAGLELDHLAVASKIIGALAVDLDGRESGWNLRDRAGEAREDRANVVGGGPRSAS